jgi:hypothetical protein
MAQELTFSCPSCGKEYPWTPQLAGKKGRCKCGTVMPIPAEEPTSSHATKSSAVMSRPMPTPKPIATAEHEPPEPEGPQDSTDGVPPVAPTEGKRQSKWRGALRSLWPGGKKR